MSTSTAGGFTRSPNKKHYRSMPSLDIQDLFDRAVALADRGLEPHSAYSPLEGEARKKYGDFAFFGVQDICDQLREKDPHLFYHTRPIDIAKRIKNVFEAQKYRMIKRLVLRSSGILTFRLEGRWMARRIKEMLNDGIDKWAPKIYEDAEKTGKAVFVFPANPRIDADIVRAIYMKDALVNLYLYSGADVGSGFCNDEARHKAHEHFTEKKGGVVSKMHRTSLNGPSHDVYTDLATLWYGAKIQNADVLVYLTPHQLRGYIEQCHIAAAKEGWLQYDWNDLDSVVCCEFQTFSGEQQKLCDFWDILESEDRVAWERLQKLSFAAGYNPKTFLECAFKFTCLKSHRLAECIFKYEDFAEEEGNTLASLLKTEALVRSLIKNSPGRNSKLNRFAAKELSAKERELELHVVEFTEVINTACRAFVPHVLCEYLCGLSKLFTCSYHEVWQVKPGKNMLWLCEATEVVMNKCFQLLGIASSSIKWSKEFKSFFDRKEARPTQLHIIPEDARNELYPNSRFEIFSMNVSVLHSQFDEGYVTGRVTFVDKCRLANSDGWVGLDKKDNCYVSYFNREWYNAVTINNGSYVPLGNTSSVHSVPFSSSIEVALLIRATSKETNLSYLIYNGNAGADLTKFWDGDLNTMCGTIKRESKDGRVLLDFVAIKDAVDTTMELTFNPVKDVRLSGSLTASYGNDILGDLNFLGQYTAHIFKADSRTKYIRCEKPHSLPLHKSAMAVPVNGCLRMHADLVDVGTERHIVDEKVELRKSESSNGVSRWKFECDEGFFELTVKWAHQARRS